MSTIDEIFFTTVGCMDGRVQEPVAMFGRKAFGAQYPDTITEAGLVGRLSKDVVDPVLKEKIRKKIVDVSMRKHHARGIIVHGHQECAGNPVEDDEHIDDIRKATDFVRELIQDTIPVIGVWVKRSSNGWIAEEVTKTVSV